MEKDDLRNIDMDLLSKHNIEGWGSLWEEALNKHTSLKFDDINQNRWHLSRLSYLAGYLIAKGKSDIDVEEILNKYLEKIKLSFRGKQ